MLSAHAVDKKEDIVIFGKGPIDELDEAEEAEFDSEDFINSRSWILYWF